MRVIKDNEVYIDWTVRFLCRHCNTKLEINADDVRIYRDRMYWVECLECEETIILAEDGVPQGDRYLLLPQYVRDYARRQKWNQNQ